MMGFKSLHATSATKLGQEALLAPGKRGYHLGPRTGRLFDAITAYFTAPQDHRPGLYLPLVRIDKDR